MSYLSSLPPAEPSLIKAGIYSASLAGEASERTSNYKGDNGRANTYWTLPLILRNEAGEEFTFMWFVKPKSQLYLKFLQIMGGLTTKSGKVNPPLDNTENAFMINLGERQSRDKTKLVNEVQDVWIENWKANNAETSTDKTDRDNTDTPF